MNYDKFYDQLPSFAKKLMDESEGFEEFKSKYNYFILITDSMMNNQRQIKEWCNETLGNDKWFHLANWYCFETKEDLVAFKLRWL